MRSKNPARKKYKFNSNPSTNWKHRLDGFKNLKNPNLLLLFLLFWGTKNKMPTANTTRGHSQGPTRLFIPCTIGLDTLLTTVCLDRRNYRSKLFLFRAQTEWQDASGFYSEELWGHMWAAHFICSLPNQEITVCPVDIMHSQVEVGKLCLPVR